MYKDHNLELLLVESPIAMSRTNWKWAFQTMISAIYQFCYFPSATSVIKTTLLKINSHKFNSS